MRFFLAPLFLFGAFFSFTPVIHAAGLTWVSDLISTSLPAGTSTSHTITFTPTVPIPIGGKIVITPDATGDTFDIPALLDFSDIDMATAPTSTGPYVDRSLASSPSGSDEGVLVVSGTAGSITITLGSAGLVAGDVVRIKVGSVATVGGAGDQYIVSPAALGSHHIRIESRDAGNALLEYGSTVVVMVEPVTLGRVDTSDNVAPLRFNGLPSGLLPGSTQNVFVSFNTDKLATCKYATTSGTDYFSMLASTVFSTANADTLHYQTLTVATNTIYQLYVRCQKYTNTPNQDDYLITFEVGVQPAVLTPPPPPPAPSGGSSGSGGGGGSGGPFLGTGEVTIEGLASPFAKLVILKDGVIERESVVSVLGNFSEKFTGLSRGTYTWSAYVKDSTEKLSSTYSSTIYLIAKTNNMIAPVYMSPTLHASSTTVPVGESIRLKGYGIALTQVQVIMNKQGNTLTGNIISATTTANGNGSWSIDIPTTSLAKGTYEAKAVSILANRDHSLLSPIVYIGLGENPTPDFSNRSDLNKDKKVNLIDFSILLFNWKGTDAVSDINQDGTVNLTDFSIMLANWTG
jgi:hypothetical protein